MSKLSELNRRQFIWLTGVGAAAVGGTSFTSHGPDGSLEI
jgi:hypothetical protein